MAESQNHISAHKSIFVGYAEYEVIGTFEFEQINVGEGEREGASDSPRTNIFQMMDQKLCEFLNQIPW